MNKSIEAVRKFLTATGHDLCHETRRELAAAFGLEDLVPTKPTTCEEFHQGCLNYQREIYGRTGDLEIWALVRELVHLHRIYMDSGERARVVDRLEELIKTRLGENEACIRCKANPVTFPRVCDFCQDKRAQAELALRYSQQGIDHEEMMCRSCGMIYDGGMRCTYCGDATPTG